MTDALFHIVSARDWAVAEAVGTYAPQSLTAEGFVHCSYAHQVAGVAARRFAGAPDVVAARRFAGAPDVVVVEIDPRGLDVRVEDLYGEGVAYPHVYGPIPIGAAVAVRAVDDFRSRHTPTSRERG